MTGRWGRAGRRTSGKVTSDGYLSEIVRYPTVQVAGLFRVDRPHHYACHTMVCASSFLPLTPQPLCLVCEDEALIAMTLESDLDEAGIRVAGPFATCANALAWAEANTPDLALLDYRLRDGVCTPLALHLRRQGVPVVICSGWPEGTAGVPPGLRGLPWLMKPADPGALLAAVREAVGASAPLLTSLHATT